jgi:hypothetical protein
MGCVAQIPSRKAAEVLVLYLRDQTDMNWGSTYGTRFCDSAAEALITMLDLSKQFPPEGEDKESDQMISKLHAWWLNHRDSVDWQALRQKAKASRAPKKG